VPGVRLAQWPLYDSLRTLDRPAQVDGVIRALLGGAVSSDTRAVLISGRNPFLAARGGADALMALDGADSTDAPDPMTPAMRPRRRGNLAGSASAPTGLAHIVGLALGAPEFQRR
jgi:hypothetical protein